MCNLLYKDEELVFEMMYKLIDTENNSSGLNERKGIIDSLDAIIKQTFYKNEEDAQRYYLDRMIRKKEMGGSYNEKFLDMPNKNLMNDDTGVEDE